MKIKFSVLARFSVARFVLLLLLPLFLTSCAGIFGSRSLDIPLAKLQEGVNKRFPLNNRFLEVFDITLSNPQVTLLPDVERIVLTVESSIAPPLTSKRWNGRLAISGSLQYDLAKNAIMLTDPRIEELKHDGIDPAQSRQFSKLGNFLAERLFKEAPVYAFKPEDLRRGGTNFVPIKITTKSNALVISFEPVK